MTYEGDMCFLEGPPSLTRESVGPEEGGIIIEEEAMPILPPCLEANVKSPFRVLNFQDEEPERDSTQALDLKPKSDSPVTKRRSKRKPVPARPKSPPMETHWPRPSRPTKTRSPPEVRKPSVKDMVRHCLMDSVGVESIRGVVRSSVLNPTELCAVRSEETGSVSVCWQQVVNNMVLGVHDLKHAQVAYWDIAQVVAFIGSVVDDAIVLDAISDAEIDGEAMLLLTLNDLTCQLKLKLGPALKVYHTILAVKHSLQTQ